MLWCRVVCRRPYFPTAFGRLALEFILYSAAHSVDSEQRNTFRRLRRCLRKGGTKNPAVHSSLSVGNPLWTFSYTVPHYPGGVGSGVPFQQCLTTCG